MIRTKQQSRAIYSLLNKLNIDDSSKESIVLSFTNNRTTHTSELNYNEAAELIKSLNNELQKNNNSDFWKGDKMRKRIFSLCYTYNWTIFKNRKEIVDIERLNRWMIKYSYLKKPLNKYKYSELPELVSQFEKVVKTFIESDL